ncbi:MAG: hypothetical protein WDN29_14760 [Methylovirgula sp.]
MDIKDELQDRYGAAATPDAKRLAHVVKMIFEKVEMEFGAQAGHVSARVMTNTISDHLAKARNLLGQACFASILIDTMPPT